MKAKSNDKVLQKLLSVVADYEAGRVSSEVVRNKISSEVDIQKFVLDNAGNAMVCNNKLIDFGSGAQLGDVRIRDIAGRDIITVTAQTVQENNLHISHSKMSIIGELSFDFANVFEQIGFNYFAYRKYFGSARDHFYAKDWDGAIKNLDQAVLRMPDDPDTYMLRGFAYLEKGEFRLALNDANKSLSCKVATSNDSTKKLGFVCLLRGLSYYALDQYDVALQDINRAISLIPVDNHIYYIRGCLYVLTKQVSLALQDFNEVLKIDV